MTENRSKWLALAFLLLAQFMIMLDIAIVNVALPSIQRDFDLTVVGLQSIVTAYTLLFGGFLLLGGRAADLFGRRLVFISGVVGFTVISFLLGLAHRADLLVPLRALQGLFGAFIAPSALSLALNLFTGPLERARALSFWGAVSAGGAIAGLLLGGFLSEYFGWRWNFFVNVPLGALIAAAAYRLLPASAGEEKNKSLDLPGAVLVTGGLMLLVYTLTKGNAWGWGDPQTLGMLGLAAVLLVGFVINEMYAEHPLIPLSIFEIGNVAPALLVQFPITAGLYATFFFVSLYIQTIMNFSPLKAGLAFLPMSLIIGLGSVLAPRLIRKIGYRPILVFAPLLMLIGQFIFSQTKVDGTYMDILPGLLITAAGLGFTFVSLTMAATGGVPKEESGLASGLLSTAQQFGGSLGLAILTSLAAVAASGAYASGTPATESILAGYHAAFYTSMLFALLASIMAFFFVRRPRVATGLENLPVS